MGGKAAAGPNRSGALAQIRTCRFARLIFASEQFYMYGDRWSLFFLRQLKRVGSNNVFTVSCHKPMDFIDTWTQRRRTRK